MGKPDSSRSCALCAARAPLEQSHIIPQFVYRGLKEAPGRQRFPDGPTKPLLCGKCEDRFSAHESEFARLVFHPLVANPNLAVKYDNWLLKFAASVCWRILEDTIRENRLARFDGRWGPPAEACRETWRQYLLGKRSGVGGHSIHLLRWDGATGGSGLPLPAHSDRDLRQAVGMDVACLDDAAFVYAKLGPIIFFGLIADPDPRPWPGTRLCLEGKLKPREFLVPARQLDYILSRARRGAGR